MKPVRIDAVWPFVVTTTSALPALCGGVAAVIVVGLTTLTSVAGAPPIVTPAPAAKFAPVIVTFVPPRLDPALGVMLLMRGVVDEGLVVEPPHAETRAASVSRVPSGDRRKVRACKFNSILPE